MITVTTVGELKAAIADFPDDMPLGLRVYDQRTYGPDEFPYPGQFYVSKVRLHYVDNQTKDIMMLSNQQDLRTQYDAAHPLEVS